MNYGRLDISTISLAAEKWLFALPRNLHWPTVRANPPKLVEPEGRYFIHCLQHWIVRFPRHYPNRFRKYTLNELDQETILVDNHGQIYVIYALAGMPNDWGVHWFTLTPNMSYNPLTLSQIEAVKGVSLPAVPEGEEGLPSLKKCGEVVSAAIREAIRSAEPLAPVEPDPLAEQGVFEQVGRKVINPAAPEEPEVRKKRVLMPDIVREIQQAYIDVQYGSNYDEKEFARQTLAYHLKAAMPKQFHRRIDAMNRTMLSRKLAKYYEITFPKSVDKVIPPGLPSMPEVSFWLQHLQY